MYINPELTIQNMAAAKKQTKADLENKIVELEAKLNKLATQLETKPVEVKPAETKPVEVKPAETKPAEVKPAETKPAEVKPAETKPVEVKPVETKPKGTLPKGTDTKPAPAKPAERPAATTKPKGTLPKGMEAKPAEAPKPAETTSQPPATVQEALENAYMTAPMTSFHDYRAKVTGYSPAPNRYFVRANCSCRKSSNQKLE